MNRPPFFAPSERNKQPILEQLKKLIPAKAHVLEIGSGWGQHGIHFCRNMPGLLWQPSEKPEKIAKLTDHLASAEITQILPPLELNVHDDQWPRQEFDAAYSANTAHIMSWSAVVAMFAGVASVLIDRGAFYLYGPFNINGEYTSDGNREFDTDLRSRNPDMGIRDTLELERLARDHQLTLVKRISMPANNFLLVFEKNAKKENRLSDERNN